MLKDGERTRLWAFTNFDLQFDYEAAFGTGKFTYIAYGLETAPTTGRLHHQGWMRLKNQSGSFKGTAKLLGQCTVGPMVETLAQNETYCSKEGTLTELGVKPKQGERTDITAILGEIKEGKTEEQIMEDHPEQWVQYGRRFEDARALLTNHKRRWATELVIFWGAPGVGKSLRADTLWPDADHVSWDGKFMNGYTHAETVIFDEFEGRHGPAAIPELMWLQLVDRYPMTINVKNNRNCQWNPRRIVFTSNRNPNLWYGSRRSLRRIEEYATSKKMTVVLRDQFVKLQRRWRNYRALSSEPSHESAATRPTRNTSERCSEDSVMVDAASVGNWCTPVEWPEGLWKIAQR